MNLDSKQKDHLNKDEVGLVQKRKHEYKLLDSFSRTAGLKLFSYNSNNQEIKEVIIKTSDTRHCELTVNGWINYDTEQQKAIVDSRLIFFESLNLKSATNRVGRYLGELHKLSNMKPVKNGCIKLY